MLGVRDHIEKGDANMPKNLNPYSELFQSLRYTAWSDGYDAYFSKDSNRPRTPGRGQAWDQGYNQAMQDDRNRGDATYNDLSQFTGNE